MCDAGKDPDKFRSRMTALHHHARDVNARKEDNCNFHAMFVVMTMILCSSDNEFVHSRDEAITIVHITHTHCLYATEVQFKEILQFPVMNT